MACIQDGYRILCGVILRPFLNVSTMPPEPSVLTRFAANDKPADSFLLQLRLCMVTPVSNLYLSYAPELV